MMYGKKMASGKGKGEFKPCSGCPSPSKCSKAGACAMKKTSKKGK